MTCPTGHELAEMAHGYCALCAICSQCQQRLRDVEYRWCLERNDGIMIHPLCAALLPQAEGMVTVPLKQYDYLNACRLLIEPLGECSTETNKYDAECRLNATRFVHLMTLEQKFLMLSRLERLSASLSLILSKDRKTIEIELNKREKAKFDAATKQTRIENRPKSERHTLTQRDKAIKALLAIPGMTEAEAILAVDSRLKEQGKVIN